MSDAPSLPRRIADWIVVVAFAAMIGIPFLDTFVRFDNTPLSAKRFSTFPNWEWNIRALAGFPGQAKFYLEENFGCRAWMIRMHGLVKVRLMKISSNPEVVLGRDGWLFLAGEGALDTSPESRPFSNQELAGWSAALTRWHEYLRSQQIEFLFVVTPNKHSIYPEHLPVARESGESRSRLTQLLAWLAAAERSERVRTPDLRLPLLTRKADRTLYYRTDTHWNDAGAMIAAESILSALSDAGLAAPMLLRNDWILSEEVVAGGDLARMLGLKYDYQERAVQVRPRSDDFCFAPARRGIDIQPERLLRTSCENAPIGKAIVFRDSFCTQLIPILQHAFQEAIWVWSHEIDAELIARESPDVVILQFVERRLATVSADSIGRPDGEG